MRRHRASTRESGRAGWMRPARLVVAVLAAVAALATPAVQSASAAASDAPRAAADNPYQRGPDPTVGSDRGHPARSRPRR